MSDTRMIMTNIFRNPQGNIPVSKQERNTLLEVIQSYVCHEHLVPPLTLKELEDHSRLALEISGLQPKYADFASVLMNNEVWRDTVAGISYDKRLLLLSKCLRDAENCPASFDEIGLLCEQCGRCVIGNLKGEAEQLGYTVLIAEGSPIVMTLVESGQIECIVGVSCLSVLEQIFPYMEAGVIPAIAIPLLQDGCINTSVDVDWVTQTMYLTTDDPSSILDYEKMHQQVEAWFNTEHLTENFIQNSTGVQYVTCKDHESKTEKVMIDWMAQAGKRWRPYLTTCTYFALSENEVQLNLEDLRKVAISVECFHKASLIHDDIEDGDDERYGQKTLHERYGVPIALNVGDLLIGEGYRLLTELSISDAMKVQLLDIASQGHRNLCLGQGSELSWTRRPGPMTIRETLDIFRLKTSPAFEVALTMGATLADSDEQIINILKQYSEALGIAYQIRDDLEDIYKENSQEYNVDRRLSILHSLAYENAVMEDKRRIERFWKGSSSIKDCRYIYQIICSPEIENLALNLESVYIAEAYECCSKLSNSNLKRLLHRVISKMFYDFEAIRWCNK